MYPSDKQLEAVRLAIEQVEAMTPRYVSDSKGTHVDPGQMSRSMTRVDRLQIALPMRIFNDTSRASSRAH